MENPEFKTIKSYSINYGTRNFIEIAIKEAAAGEETNKFISISKGFTDQQGNKRYKRSLGFETNKEVIDFMIKTLPEIKKEIEGAPATKKAKKEKTE